MGKGKGFCKVILFGEHFVVYGVKGVVAPISSYVEVEVVKSNKDEVIPPYQELRMNALKIAKKELGIEDGVSLKKAEFNTPESGGIGRSAAFAVAITRALADEFNIKLSEEEVNKVAFEIEKYFHGNPSGIDNTVATYKKPLIFQKGKEPVFFEMEPLNILLVSTGKRGDTKHLVLDVVKPLADKNKEIFESLCNTASLIVDEGIKALKEGNIEKIGELMNINQGLLYSIGVSTKEIEEILLSTKKYSYGGKLTGAGGGGNVIILPKNKDKVKEILNELGYKYEDIMVGK